MCARAIAPRPPRDNSDRPHKMTANVLANETSPYLLQHKENPVHWQAWGPETLALAGRILVHLAPGTALPPGHPASGKDQLDGRATAYVCRGTRCGLPVTEAEALRAALSAKTAGGASP